MATALPAPCQSSPAWLLRYLTVQSALLNGSQPLRVVSFAPRANVGMGNRIVGLLEAAFTAAASDSLLALDYSNFGDGSESQYLRPNLIRWDASEWPAELRAQAQRQRQGAGKLRTAKQVTAAVSGQHKALEMTTSGAMTLVPSLRGTASLQPALADRVDRAVLNTQPTRRRPRAFTDREAVAHRRDGTAVFIRVTVAKAAPLDGGVTT